MDFLIATPLLQHATSNFAAPLSVPDHGTNAQGSPVLTRSLYSQVSSGWDPSLLCILGFVIPFNMLAFYLVQRRATPVYADAFPTRTKPLDWNLVVGSVIFGVGWGIAGICPGPGLAGLVSGRLIFVVWAAAVCVGMTLFAAVQRIVQGPPQTAAAAVAASAAAVVPQAATLAPGMRSMKCLLSIAYYYYYFIIVVVVVVFYYYYYFFRYCY